MPTDTMDAPDLQVREAAMRAKLGQKLSPEDVRRLSTRQYLEADAAKRTGLTRTATPPRPAASFWRNNGNGTSTEGRFNSPQAQVTKSLTGLTPSYAPQASNAAPRNTAGLPVSPPAIRSAITPALPPATPAALTAALPTPGAPVASATTSRAQQTESANPLSGDGNAQPAGTSAPIKPGPALGLTQRGTTTPRGQDALPDDDAAHYGGTGLYRKRFTDPKSATTYGNYVKSLFGGAGAAAENDDDGDE